MDLWIYCKIDQGQNIQSFAQIHLEENSDHEDVLSYISPVLHTMAFLPAMSNHYQIHMHKKMMIFIFIKISNLMDILICLFIHSPHRNRIFQVFFKENGRKRSPSNCIYQMPLTFIASSTQNRKSTSLI